MLKSIRIIRIRGISMSIYVDYAATTPIDEKIMNSMLENASKFGNPSSIHRLGKEAKAFYEGSRKNIAKRLNAQPEEIIFTGSATEANNQVIRGTVQGKIGAHVITTKTEHASVKETYADLEKEHEVTYVDVDDKGLINLEQLKSQLRDDTLLVSIILVNNETGTIQPIKEISKIVKEKGALLHIDAVQAFKYLPIDVTDLNCDFLTLSGHKLYAPKGIGLLYLKSNTHLHSLITGGSQERERRAGTENTLFAHAFRLAIEEADDNRDKNNQIITDLKQSLIEALEAEGVPFEINGDIELQTSHILNLYFPWTETEYLLTALDLNGIYASGGSACNAGTVIPSHVITAMYDEARSNRSIRFSFSEKVDKNDITQIAKVLNKIYKNLNDSGFIN